MADRLARCRACRKPIVRIPGKRHCARCTSRIIELTGYVEEAIHHGLREPASIAHFAGAAQHEVEDILHQSSYLNAKVPSGARCRRCMRSPATPRSEYCHTCRRFLARQLGNAVELVREHIRERAVRRSRGRELRHSESTGRTDAIKQKRNRRVLRRRSPVAKNRWSNR